ncbi:MAG: PAS domain S-box protein, partial [Planctomycetota bacterium]
SGEPYWVAIEVRPIRDEEDQVTRFIGIESDISQRKKAEEERARLSEELQRAAHHAGMAEIATGVLHNIGNVLNSINVSVRYIQDSIQTSGAQRLTKLIETVQDHEEDLLAYLATDPKGQKVWPYLKVL